MAGKTPKPFHVSTRTRQRMRRLDFAAVYGSGEIRYGQTANGTTCMERDAPGWNRQYNFGDMPQVEPTGPWGNSNRTGE